MHSIKTPGIVIKRTNLGEADKLLTILTQRLGKVKAVAKGIKKIKSKMAGSLEPFMLLDLQLYEGKTFYTITGVNIIQDYGLGGEGLVNLSRAFFLGELLDRFLEERQKSESLFEYFAEGLSVIGKSDKELIFWHYCLKIIEKSGFSPSLYDCVHCHEKLKNEQNFWDSIEGGVICLLCEDKHHHGKKVSNELIKILRLMDSDEVKTLERINVSREKASEISEILKEYICSIIGREMKSDCFLC